MSVIAFFENERRQIRKVDYAKLNIYQLDNILDMWNGEMATPSEDARHLVLVGIGRWICYFLVDHPNKGRCHFQPLLVFSPTTIAEQTEICNLTDADHRVLSTIFYSYNFRVETSS